MSSSKKNVQFAIKVTNFINPHLFHFKLENVVGQMDADIENELMKDAQKTQWTHSTGYRPKKNEIVSAYVLEWEKWVRAQVDLILEDSHGEQYVLWCLDQGVPIKLSRQYVLPMPLSLQLLPGSAFVGGLAKCVPIEKHLNFAQMKHETKTIDEFPEYVITAARQLLEEAAEINFTPRQRIDDHIFGDIKITKYSGKKVELLVELANREGVQADVNFIPQGIETWRTINKSRYENHLGHLNVQNMVKLVTNIKNGRHSSKISVCSTDMDEDLKMVLDWSRQNNAFAKEMERDLKQRFEQVVNGLDAYVKSDRVENKPHLKMYNLGSYSSVNRSSLSLGLERFNSRSTLTEVQSEATHEKPRKPRTLSRLTERLKDVSIASSKPKDNAEIKKVAFIPAGFERDILEFQKYNQI